MDYEKEYKDMVQRARELHESGNALTQLQMEIVCPALAESEDERLRKLLVWQVHRNIEDETNDLAQSVYDGIKGHDPDIEESIEDWKKCLAYLENIIAYEVLNIDDLEWLKFLPERFNPQPHWKPSEEQMKALERAIVKMHTPNDIDILAELRDNLKKLLL